MNQKTTKIYNSSKDPVLVKKIGLRLWSLRDEVKATVKSELSRNKISVDNPNLTNIIQEYTTGKIVTDDAGNEKEVNLGGLENPAPEALAQANPAEPPPGVDPDEFAMAQAISEGNKTPEAPPAPANEEPVAQAAQAETSSNDKPIILQRLPELDPEEVCIGRAMLSEINMDKMFFFCEKKFMEGQAIVIEFLVPKRFVLNAEVLYCIEFNMKSRIISKNKLPYRTIVKFTFLKEGERTLLRDFVKSIAPNGTIKTEAPA